MGELYIASVNLLVPSGERLVQVTPDWGIEVDGKHQTGYMPEEALVFSALCAKKDEVLALDVMPKLVLDTHEDAVSKGAISLPISKEGIDAESEAVQSRARVIRIVDRLLKARLGLLSSNIYKLRLTRPISYLLCTDITEDKLGLDTIKSRASYFETEHIRRFRAQRATHLLDEKKWLNRGTLGTNQPIKPKASAPPLPKPILPADEVVKAKSAQPRSSSNGFPTTATTHNRLFQPNKDIKALTKSKIMEILEADAGSSVSSRSISYEFTRLGFTRRQIENLFLSIDTFILPQYHLLKKIEDPKDKNHILYVRTNVPLVKK